MPLFLFCLRAELINIDLGEVNGFQNGVDGQCGNKNVVATVIHLAEDAPNLQP